MSGEHICRHFDTETFRCRRIPNEEEIAYSSKKKQLKLLQKAQDIPSLAESIDGENFICSAGTLGDAQTVAVVQKHRCNRYNS